MYFPSHILSRQSFSCTYSIIALGTPLSFLQFPQRNTGDMPPIRSPRSNKIHIMRSANASYPLFRRAPALPQVEHDTSSTASLINVDSPHISSVPSDYSGETSTQAEREEREAEDMEREAKAKFEEASNETKENVHKGKEVAGEKYQKGKEVAGDKYQKAKEVASEKYEKGKEVASEKGRKAKAKTEEKGRELNKNRDNPVVVGNMVLIGLGSAALGYVPLLPGCA